jgi:hypothetical protein
MAEDPPDTHELPTPRSTLQARSLAVLLTCRSCYRSREADLEGLVAAGRGDVPLFAGGALTAAVGASIS